MSKNIIFTKVTDLVSDEFVPRPASEFLPDWYKKTDSYIGLKKDVEFNSGTVSTIKRCMPVFDALTSGYIIPTYADLWVKKNHNGDTMYITSSPIDIEFHSISQAPYHPSMNQIPYPKWNNPWAISTPKGYSCIFMPPVHSGNTLFTILEGVVDTDKYPAPVNFPFVLNDVNFEGLIPAGTPMAQIIPFKRDEWTHSFGSEKDLLKTKDTQVRLSTRFHDRYKKIFWSKKSYR
jgi:hypothetical protein